MHNLAGLARSSDNVLTRIIGILLLCSLVGCGSGGRTPADQSGVILYVVERGDTLYSIAFRYGLDYREVARVNKIYDPYIIYPGQNIYLWQLPSGSPKTPVAPVASSYPQPVAPAPGTGPVVVTAVPGVAAAPVSQVVKPPVPVTGSSPPVAVGRSRVPTAPVQTPVIETPPIGAPVPPAGAGAVAFPATGPAPVSDPQLASGPESLPAAVTATAMATPPAPVSSPAPTPAPTPAASPGPARAPTPGGKIDAWRWPASGAVTRSYSSSVHKGIDIGGNRGDPIYAVADGTVVYAGTGIVGFGELLIVKHNDIYISAYGHNDRLLVRENEVVGAGQIIAEKGSSGTDTVKLHFEIRQEGKPIDPLLLLPGR